MMSMVKKLREPQEGMKPFFRFSHRTLFLIDGIGAVISATFLGYILIRFNEYIGMPISVLKFLAAVAKIFAVYSFVNYFLKPKNWRRYLKLIAIANTIYCLITVGFVLYNFQHITILGISYFIGEIIIIVVLVNLELKAARNIK